MSRERSVSTFSRRRFLKAAGIGVASTVVLLPVEVGLVVATERLLNSNTGNAGREDRIEEECSDSEDPRSCVNDYKFSTDEKVHAVATAPVLEETVFRGLPSAFCGDSKNANAKYFVNGTGGYGLTRREVVYGAVSSVLFGAVHNISGSGFNTDTIPVSQTFGGACYWYLQRKLGIASNLAAHASFNAVVVSADEISRS